MNKLQFSGFFTGLYPTATTKPLKTCCYHFLAVLITGFSLQVNASSCTQAEIQAISPKNTTIDSAEELQQPVPHCRIEGHIITTKPGPNQVDFRLQLPLHNWSGRYYFIGMGGTAGYVPTDSQIPTGNPLHQGFAVAGTNTGHYSRGNWSFLAENKAKALDHAHRGAHVTAVSTQQITREFYQADNLYRYHSGCSGGGRMGMAALTQHPEDFDGILIGAPAIGPERSTETMLGFIYMAQQLTREPGAWLSPAKLQFAEGKVTQHCDALDGAMDDMIWNHNACSFDFNQLSCSDTNQHDQTAASNNSCLTKAEINTIEALLAGPQGPSGKIKAGFPISNMSLWSRFIGFVPPPWPEISVQSERDLAAGSPGYLMANTLAKAYFGEDYNSLEEFDFNNQTMLDNWMAAAHRVGYGIPFSLDISPFSKQGGKVIFWNGVSDPCCSDNDLEKYYREAGEVLGGADQMQSTAKLYRIPGMGHCGSGTGPQDAPDQLFKALINWVENGQPPASVKVHRGETATHLFSPADGETVSGVPVPRPKGESRDFLLCPHPQTSQFIGAPGEELSAKHWRCSQPPLAKERHN